MQDKLYTVKETAPLLGVTAQTIWDWIALRKITYIRVGGRFRISQKTIAEILTPHHAKQD